MGSLVCYDIKTKVFIGYHFNSPDKGERRYFDGRCYIFVRETEVGQFWREDKTRAIE